MLLLKDNVRHVGRGGGLQGNGQNGEKKGWGPVSMTVCSRFRVLADECGMED